MALSQSPSPSATGSLVPGLIGLCEEAARAAGTLLSKATAAIRDSVSEGGKVSTEALEREQHAAHGLAWAATYVQSLKQMAAYAARMEEEGRFGGLEALITQIAASEYLGQIAGGIPMSQGEIIRPAALGLTQDDIASFTGAPAVSALLGGNSAPARAALAELIAKSEGAATFGDAGLEDIYDAMREEMRRFSESEIAPHAHGWHLANAYVPMEVIEKMSALGVFGLTIPEEHGGLGLGKESMCVVSEELSRGYIGVGSLGTRSEIAAELIGLSGTGAQKEKWLPGLASGEIIPTAVFTEPNVGSDLASMKTRAVRDGDIYRITGQKTWITHAARADLMTLMARTDGQEKGYKGLSMFLVEKPRGSDGDPFPGENIAGSEIEVLGYRGMKEYDVSFDGLIVPADALLGGEEGQGFKQLMKTFEGARIQTAARAIGVAQNALDLALRYAQERRQFGKALYAFPRVSDKIVMMAVEIMIARQLTYFAAREKDAGHRCDLEAGMAKLLSARVAWAAADNAVQIHGGNGFALEFPVSRVLCDARILSIFEGAAEIQANVIARRVLEG
ncbi:MAG TPA: acyl-CoA dehydrogenase [Rhizobiales bacterium]|nr:acyl-CoA dehydrogenase [bacterium BMS3Bbin10]HDO52952.1 acyl-CoA dehydrogenase [Hyphomicrobiales bacterium]